MAPLWHYRDFKKLTRSNLIFLTETCNSYISILTQSTLSSAKVMKINAVYRSNLVKSCYFCVLQLCALLSPIYVILYKCWTCFDSFYLILFVPEEGKTETSCSNEQELKAFGFHNTVHLYRFNQSDCSMSERNHLLLKQCGLSAHLLSPRFS